MDYIPGKPRIGLIPVSSKDPPRVMAGGSKSGQVAATPFGRLGKDYTETAGVALKHSFNYTRGAETKPPKISDNYVKPKTLVAIPHLNAKVSADRNPSTENLSRTQATGERVRPKSRDDEEKDTLKRTQDIKAQHKFKDVEEDTCNVGFRKSQVLDTTVRHERQREPSKSKTFMRHSDGTRHLTGHGSEKTVMRDSGSGKNWLEGKTVVRPAQLDDEKKNKVSSARKRPEEEGGKDVHMRTATKISEPIRFSAIEANRAAKLVTTSTIKSKQDKQTKRAFSIPGQRYETPEERDALRLFYASLHRQIPTSDMANIWLMEHGLLEANEAQRVLTHKLKPKVTLPLKVSLQPAPTQSGFSNRNVGKMAKFRNEDYFNIKPVSKKLKL